MLKTSLVIAATSVLLGAVVGAWPLAWAQSVSEPPVSLAQSAERAAQTAAAAVPPAQGAHRSGYYFRGSLAFERARTVEFRDEDCFSQSPAALYGCGTGNDGEPLHGLVDSGTTVGFELGLGRVLTPWLRLEGAVHYRPGVSLDGEANFVQTQARQDVSVKFSTYGALAAAYVDIPWPAQGYGIPFVGAGLGAARIDVGETRMTFTRTRTLVPGGQRTNFTWMVTAGIGIPVGERVTLDLAWRYTDYGTIGTEAGAGAIVWHDGSRDPLELELAPTQGRLRAHGGSIGLRYAF